MYNTGISVMRKMLNLGDTEGEGEARSLILMLLDCIDPLVSALEANTARVLALATILESEGYYGEAAILRKAAFDAAQELLVGEHGFSCSGSGAERVDP